MFVESNIERYVSTNFFVGAMNEISIVRITCIIRVNILFLFSSFS